MDQFLPLLKRPASIREHETDNKPVYFCIGNDTNGAFIYTTDPKGNQIKADYHNYNGETSNLLRTLNAIQEKKSLQFSWDQSDEHIYLDDHKYLLYQLIRCDNLRDDRQRPLQVCGEPVKLRLHIEPDETGERLIPSVIMYAGDKEQKEFTLLSDSFLLADQTIYPMPPLGDNYRQLSYFCSPFAIGQLELYLSIFYTYINNVQVAYENYECEFRKEEIQTLPTLVFEKVDEDKALFLQLTHSLPQIDYEAVERFDLIWLASIESEQKIVLRRIVREALAPHKERLSKLLAKYAPDSKQKKEIYEEDSFFIVPPDTAGPFLLHALPELLSNYVLLGAEKLKEYKIKLAQPKLNFNLSLGVDFLEGDISVDVENDHYSLQDLMSQFKKQRYIKLSDGERAIVDAGYMKRLERIFNRGKKGSKTRISFFDLPEIEELMEQRLSGEIFNQHRKIYEGFNQLAQSKIRATSINATLRPYQVEGLKWLNYLYENNLGGCLADDMGLGKTLQTIALLARIYPKIKQPSLIVMPRSLLFNWQNELSKFAPQLDVYTYYENNRNIKEAKKHSVILTTYALVRNDVEQFSKESFHCVILDESQNIKNINAQITQAIFLLQTKHRIALSGTPIENNLSELYSLFRFLNPTMFGSAESFYQDYILPIQRDGDKETLRCLRKKIYPFLLRRLKKEVLNELPDRIEQVLRVEMSPEQAAFYEKKRQYYYQQVKQAIAIDGVKKSQFVMFQALNELRRIASIPESLSDGQIASPKLSLLIDNISEAVSNGHKVVVFFNFIAGIERAGELLDNHGIDFVSMTGSTHDRKSLVERFQNDPSCKVFLITLKTGGVGLNLTAADTVFIFEPWWNKAAEEQAISRLHRIGQSNKVLSYAMITNGTIEEKIRELQEKKAELFNDLIGSDTSSSKNLSEEDIDFILG